MLALQNQHFKAFFAALPTAIWIAVNLKVSPGKYLARSGKIHEDRTEVFSEYSAAPPEVYGK